jgi:hypothetical protein
VRREGRLSAQQGAALDFRLLCASARAVQAASPTAHAHSRLEQSVQSTEELADLIRRVRQDRGEMPDPAGRFHPLPAIRKPL